MRKISKMSFAAIIVLFIVVLLVNIGLVSAHEHDFTEIKQLIDSGTACNQLADEQLEAIGDYYMEQIHPGEAHELMDNMMGGEGSASLKQVHINMAKRLYCNEDIGGMMGGGMMNMMMGNYPAYYGYNNFWNVLWMVFLIGAIALIVWLIYKFTKKGKESETPINILQKRYAKGEINKKQFEEIKKEMEE